MLAAIDLGTNSARLLIAKVEDKQVQDVHRHRIVTRMGAGINEQGLIGPEALGRTAAALEEFHRLILSKKVADVAVMGTSAARRAGNREELAKLVTDLFGKDLRILTGREEAQLSYAGAVSALAELPPETLPAVVDIGGGSVEVCIKVKGQIQALSVEMGAVRCTENPIPDEIMRKLLLPVEQMLEQVQPVVPVGVGGTVTTLAAMDQKLAVYDSRRIHGYRLYRLKVDEMLQLLQSLPLAQRKELPGLEPARADIIVAGTRILLMMMEVLKADYLTVSEADLLHGAIMELDQGLWL